MIGSRMGTQSSVPLVSSMTMPMMIIIRLIMIRITYLLSEIDRSIPRMIPGRSAIRSNLLRMETKMTMIMMTPVLTAAS